MKLRCQSTAVHLAACVLLLGATVTRAGPAPASLRVYAISPAVFDYVLTSVVATLTNAPVLSFNHRNGQTFFARVGDTLGPYCIVAFEPRVERIFTPSVNAYLDRKGGRALLRDGDGRTFALELGTPLPQPGWTACLVDLKSGAQWSAREKDHIQAAGATLSVESVSKDAVLISAGGDIEPVAPASEVERADLARLWDELAKQRAERLRLAARSQEKEPEDPFASWHPDLRQVMPQPTFEVRGRPGILIGQEYRYPSQFIVLPGVVSSSGKVVTEPFLVPTHFDTRSVGISLRIR